MSKSDICVTGRQVYKVEEIAKILGITLTELENIILDAGDGQTDLEDVLDEYENQGGGLGDLLQ